MLNRSFPEKYTESILDILGVKYEPDLPAGRWFIDFANIENKIALEVDGKQHELEDRKKSDEKKDDYLTKHGWKVYRYKWKRIRTKEDRERYIEYLRTVFRV